MSKKGIAAVSMAAYSYLSPDTCELMESAVHLQWAEKGNPEYFEHWTKGKLAVGLFNKMGSMGGGGQNQKEAIIASERLKAQTAITNYIKAHPHAKPAEVQAAVLKQIQVFKTAIAVFFPNETGPGAAIDRKAATRAARAARRNNRTSVTSKVPSGPSFLENVDRVQKKTVQKTGSARVISASSSRPNSASLKDFLSAHASAPVEVSHNVRDVDDEGGGLPPMPADPDVGPLAAQPTVEADVELVAATAATETKAEDCYINVNPPETAAAPIPPTELPAMDSTNQDTTFPAELEPIHRESMDAELAKMNTAEEIDGEEIEDEIEDITGSASTGDGLGRSTIWTRPDELLSPPATATDAATPLDEHYDAQFAEMQRHWQRLQSKMVVDALDGVPEYITHEIFDSFLVSSQLPHELCVEIAANCDTKTYENGIGEDDFSVACQLVALAQAGHPPSLDNLDVAVPLARFVTTPFEPNMSRQSFV